MSQIHQIVEKFLDDPDQMDDYEMASMVVALRKNPKLVEELKGQLQLNELLGQRYGVDRQNFVAQVDQRIRDFVRGEEEIADQVTELRTIAESELGDWDARSRRKRRRQFIGMSLVLVLVIAGSIGSYFITQNMGHIATIEFRTNPNISRMITTLTLQKGAPVQVKDGDIIITEPGTPVAYQYDDGTVVQIGGDSEIRFAVDHGGGKKVVVERGYVSADIVKQAAGPMVFETPIAIAEVRGTELLLSVVSPTITRLDVTEGSVRLALSNSTGVSATIKEGHYAIATSKQINLHKRHWPTNRDDLVFVFQTEKHSNFVTDPNTKVSQQYKLRPLHLAGFNSDGAMSLTSGAAEVDGKENADRIAREIVNACTNSNQLTIESFVRVLDLDSKEKGRVVTFSNNEFDRNFAIFQDKNTLKFQIRTSETMESGTEPILICELPDEDPHHIAVCFKPGMLITYLDGEQAHKLDSLPDIKGELSTWTSKKLVFGDESIGSTSGDTQWSGTLEGVAIYSRFLSAEEIKSNSDAYHKYVNNRRAVAMRK